MDGAFNNATKKLYGYDYQKLLAFEACLNAKENETVWIECYGDVAHNSTSYEIKHHLEQSNLNDHHIDFWKTIYNVVKQKDLLAHFTRFELITTSHIKRESIFYDWNSLKKSDKLDKLKSITTNKTIDKFHTYFFKNDESILLDVLEKFHIKSSQLNIIDKYEELKNHPAFLLVPCKHIEHFTQKMLGYISNKAIENVDKWHVDINDFKKDMQVFSKPFLRDLFPFPYVKKDEVSINDIVDFHYLKELREISIPESIVIKSIFDFLRSERSTYEIIKLHSSLAEHLDDYENELTESLHLKKLPHQDNITLENLPNEKIASISRKLFSECLSIDIKKIHGMQDVDEYFQKGRIHALVENKIFTWFFEDN